MSYYLFYLYELLSKHDNGQGKHVEKTCCQEEEEEEENEQQHEEDKVRLPSYIPCSMIW